ncbi:MAG: LamG domain-containing protein [Rhodoglobus sp.]
MSTYRHAKAIPSRGTFLGLVLLVVAAVILGSVGSAAWAYWSAGSTTGSNGASAATTVNAGNTPTASVASAAVTVSWTASTLVSGQPVGGYQIKRYNANTLALQTIKTACTGTIATTSCVESAVPDGTWKYTVTPVLGTNWLGAESAKSATVTVDTVAPTNNITLSNATGAVLSGNSIFYKGSVAGSFRLSNAVADAGSGPASSQTTALTGTTTNWSHTPSTVSGTAPYVSNIFSWTATAPGPVGEAVTGRDGAGNTATTNLTFTNDTTGPTGGTLSYVNGPTGGTSVSVTFSAGTDAGSGIGTGLLQRQSASLLNGNCGAFGAFATVAAGTNPTSPLVDTTSPSNCYIYQYVVADALGNTTTISSTNIARTPWGAFYKFDEGTGTTAADWLDGYTATLQAGAGWSAPGKTGASALNLTGASNSWASYSGPVIDTGKSYTVATWVKLSNLTGYQTFASIDGTNISPFYLQMSGGVFDFAQRGSDATGSTIAQVNGLAPSVGVWYHVAGVYDSSTGKIQLYVNGVSQGTATAVTAWTATGATAIGRSKWSGGNVDFLSGALDETRFYDSALTASQIAALAPSYSSVITGTAGLQNYWRLGDTAGTNMVDSKGGITGTYVNGPTLSAPGVTNDSNTAVQFNGSSSYATVNRTISTDFTIEFWFKTTQSYYNDFGNPHCTQWWQGASLVDADTSGPANDFGVGICSGKLIAGVGSNNGGIPDTSVVSASTYNDGAWHYAAFTRLQSTGAIQLYVDGVSVGSAAGNTAALTSTATVKIGMSNYTNYFAGTIDELAMYSTVLSGATITSHFNGIQ